MFMHRRTQWFGGGGGDDGATGCESINAKMKIAFFRFDSQVGHSRQLFSHQSSTCINLILRLNSQLGVFDSIPFKFIKLPHTAHTHTRANRNVLHTRITHTSNANKSKSPASKWIAATNCSATVERRPNDIVIVARVLSIFGFRCDGASTNRNSWTRTIRCEFGLSNMRSFHIITFCVSLFKW